MASVCGVTEIPVLHILLLKSPKFSFDLDKRLASKTVSYPIVGKALLTGIICYFMPYSLKLEQF